MKIIMGGRQTGKTERLVSLAKENNGIILVLSLRERHRLIEKYNLPDDMVRICRGAVKVPGARPLYIDGADTILQAMFRGRIKGMTMDAEPGGWELLNHE